MKFVHKEKHAKRYIYHKFCLEIPELAKLYEQDGKDWVKRKNEEREETIKDLLGPTTLFGEKKTKKELKDNLKEAEALKDKPPYILEDWKESNDATQYDRITVNKATGSYEFHVVREMSNFDILKGYNGRSQAGVTRWQDVVISEKEIPPVLPAEPLTEDDKQEIENATWRYKVYKSVSNKEDK